MRKKEELLHYKILGVLREEMLSRGDNYINPNFLNIICEGISDYYDVEDDEVNDWIVEMYSH